MNTLTTILTAARDPFFDLTPGELFLGIIVVGVGCAVLFAVWRNFKP